MKTLSIKNGLVVRDNMPEFTVRTIPKSSHYVYPLGNRWGWLYPVCSEGDIVTAGQIIASSSSPKVPGIRTIATGKMARIFKLPTFQLKEGQAIEVVETGGESVEKTDTIARVDEKADVIEVFNALFNACIWESDDYGLPVALRVVSPEVIKGFIQDTADDDLVASLKNISYLDRPIRTLVINAIDRQPYSSVRAYTLINNLDDIIYASQLLVRVSSPESIVIAVPPNLAQHESVKKFAESLGAEIAVSDGKYPAGLEPMVIWAVTGKEMLFPSRNTRILETAVVDILALYQIKQALLDGTPEMNVFVQVNIIPQGDAYMVRCPVGTPVGFLLDQFSVRRDEITKLVLGGRFLGYAHYDLQVPITGEIDVIDIFERDVFHYTHVPCIRCGFCVRVCPVNLIPAELSMYCEYKRFEEAVHSGLWQCIECGLCAYVCPAHRPMVQLMRYGKHEQEFMRVAL